MMKYEMINLDDVTDEKEKKAKNKNNKKIQTKTHTHTDTHTHKTEQRIWNWTHIPDHTYRILIIGTSGSGKANKLLNLIK